jgi:hypothetical protein
VRSRFEHRWSRGFEVLEVVDRGAADPVYRLRRRSDGAVLPATFTDEELREERRRQFSWWS